MTKRIEARRNAASENERWMKEQGIASETGQPAASKGELQNGVTEHTTNSNGLETGEMSERNENYAQPAKGVSNTGRAGAGQPGSQKT